MGVLHSPPSEITLVYRVVGKTHVFTALDMTGFHIGSSSLRCAFEQASVALGEHVTAVSGMQAQYSFEPSFEAFEAHLKGKGLIGNFVKALRSEQSAHN